MEILWAIVYGIIQGITEYLPVSSSAHLALLPKFFNFKDPGFFFDLLMHLGTALAIIVYFRISINNLISEYVKIVKSRSFKDSPYALNFSLATFSSVLLILCFKDYAILYGRSSLLIGVNLIAFGVLLYLCDLKSKSKESLLIQKNFKTSILIGISQVLAIFPGVSRSGITISSARLLGQGRKEASEFSFLLSLPIIIGSVIYKSISIFKDGTVLEVNWLASIIGVAVSFIVGVLTIHYFLKLIGKIGFGTFAIYRVVLGVIILTLI